MKYGFLGGSFNPVTKAHVELAIQSKKQFALDKVFLVPVGNAYPKEGLAKEEDRYQMLQLATQEIEGIEVLDIELGKKEEVKAIDAFVMLQKQYPNATIYYIMGIDNLATLPSWKQAEILITKYEYIVMEREGYLLEEVIKSASILEKNKEHFHLLENQDHQATSATSIRKAIQENNVQGLERILDANVYEYIQEHQLYEK